MLHKLTAIVFIFFNYEKINEANYSNVNNLLDWTPNWQLENNKLVINETKLYAFSITRAVIFI